MFWTLQDTPGGTVTLCDDCALPMTNMAVSIAGIEPFGSMKEADVVLEAMLSTVGASMGLTSSEVGQCGNCPKRLEVAQ